VHIPRHGDGDPTLLIEVFLESPGPNPLAGGKVFEQRAIEYRVRAAHYTLPLSVERAVRHCDDSSARKASSMLRIL